MTARRGLTGSDTFTLEDIKNEAADQGYVTRDDGAPPFCSLCATKAPEKQLSPTEKLNLVQRTRGNGTKAPPGVVCVEHGNEIRGRGCYAFARSVGSNMLQTAAEAAGLRLEVAEEQPVQESNGHSSEDRAAARSSRSRDNRTRRRSNRHRACTVH